MSQPAGTTHIRIRIGTRGSPLALWQANHVAARLCAALPGLAVEIRTIRTAAEAFPEKPAPAIGVGIFTKEIDEELLSGKVDLAVHSLKDVPSEVHPELTLAAVPERESPLDAFVSTGGLEAHALWDLPEGAAVGTGSPRRRAQLLHRRPDLRVVPLRGNVDTRIQKAREQGLAGTILAHAGLRRLGEETRITELISTEVLVPAVGQGALAVAGAAARRDIIALAAALEHGPSRIAITAERAFLRALRGGCQVPAGALASLEADGTLLLLGVVASPDGSRCVRAERRGPASAAEEIGSLLAGELLDRGGREVLAAVRGG